jgi:hypothetical protein
MEWIAAVALVSFIGLYLLTPKPKPQIDSKPGAITAPLCEEGLPIPVVFGTVCLREPNVVWWGDMRIVRPSNYPIRYHLSIHMALCHGELDGVQQVFAGEKPLITEPLFGNQTYYIDKYYAFGGPLQGGGVVGNAYFDMGGRCTVNGPNSGEAGLAATSNGESDGKGPGYYGIAYVEMKDIQVGTNPNINPFAYVVQRILKAQGGREEQWMPQIAAIGHGCTAEKAWAVKGGDSTSEPVGATVDQMRVWLADNMPDDDEYEEGYREGLGNLMMPAGSEGVAVPAGLPSPIIPWDDSAHMWFKQVVNIDRENTGSPLYFYVNSPQQVWVWIDGYYQGKNDPDVDNGAVNLPFVGAPVYSDDTYKKVGGAGKHLVHIYALDQDDTGEGHYIYARVVTTPVLAGQVDAATLYNRKDMNPAHIIRECLTDKIWGKRFPIGVIGASFYETAQTLYAEGLGASLAWTKQTTIEDFVKRVLELINGNLYQDRYTGMWELKLVRDDYKVEDLLTIDDDWVVNIESVNRKALGTLTNQVVVNYTSALLGDTAAVSAMDAGLVSAQAGITSETRDYVGVTTHVLASKLAIRDLRVLSTPSTTCTFTAGRKASRLQPGQAFILHKPSHGILNQVMRVAEIEFGNGRTTIVRIKCVSDSFIAGDFILSQPEGSPQVDPASNPTDTADDPGSSPEDSFASTFVAARLSDKALKREVDGVFCNGYGCAAGIMESLGWVQTSPNEWRAPDVGPFYLAQAGISGPYDGQRIAVVSSTALPPGQWRYTGIYTVVTKGYDIVNNSYVPCRAIIRRAEDMDTSEDVEHGCVFHISSQDKWCRLLTSPEGLVLNGTDLSWEFLDTYSAATITDKLLNAADAQSADGVGSSLDMQAVDGDPGPWITFKTGEFPAATMPAGAFRFDVNVELKQGDPFKTSRFECQLCVDDDPNNPTVLATRETDAIRNMTLAVVTATVHTTAAQDLLGKGLVYRFRLVTDSTDTIIVGVAWGDSNYQTRVMTPLSLVDSSFQTGIDEFLEAFGPSSPLKSLSVIHRRDDSGYLAVDMDVLAESHPYAPFVEATTVAEIIVNGSGETGGSDGGVPTGWTAENGACVWTYASQAHGELSAVTNPADRGLHFFTGGLASEESTLVQAPVDFMARAVSVDAGAATWAANGWFGGYNEQNDHAYLELVFKDEDGEIVGTGQIGGVTAADRSSVSTLLYREGTGAIPVGARSVVVRFRSVRTEGTQNNGYADKLAASLLFGDAHLDRAPGTITAEVDPSDRESVSKLWLRSAASVTGWVQLWPLATVSDAGVAFSDVTTGNTSTEMHGFAPKLPGGTNKFLRGDGTWAEVSGSASTAAMVTAYEVDLSTLATANLKTGGDGVKTIDGKPWTLANSANGQAVAVNDGTHAGIYLRASTANTDDYTTTYNGVRLVAGLSDLSGIKLRDTTEFWLWVMFSQPHVPDYNYEFARLGVQMLPALPDTAGTYQRISLIRGFNAAVSTGIEWRAGGTSPAAPSTKSMHSVDHDVYAFRLLSNMRAECYAGASVAGAFPAIADLQHVIDVAFGTAAGGYVTPSIAASGTATQQWGFHCNVATVNTRGNADLLLRKLRIQYKV